MCDGYITSMSQVCKSLSIKGKGIPKTKNCRIRFAATIIYHGMLLFFIHFLLSQDASNCGTGVSLFYSKGH